MKLTVISRYASQKAQYEAGKEIEVDPADAEFLLKDAPGCFEPVDEDEIEPVDEGEVEPVDEGEKAAAAPVDKMHRGHRNK